MVERRVNIRNELGLHARPAAHFVKLAAQFQADVFLIKDGLRVNGKSIMGVMMLAAEMDSQIIIQAQGSDEDRALEALVKLVEDKFYEQ
ncbi:HPr family phosphocarrier protein [candidate division KSB1 bacterium]|nr:HPr family phosphocarrier protein [candidate division KSB1 bacterium]